MTPARWKHERVTERVENGEPFAQAVWGMQSDYIDAQAETLVDGTFLEWLD
jgi:hypothetical protein